MKKIAQAKIRTSLINYQSCCFDMLERHMICLMTSGELTASLVKGAEVDLF